LRRFERNVEFYYEDGGERITRTRINFTSPKTGKWYLIIENKEKASALFHYYIKVGLMKPFTLSAFLMVMFKMK